MANDQTHDVPSKHSSLTEINNEKSKQKLNNISSDINHEDYKKTIDQISLVQTDKTSIASPFDATNESTQTDVTPSKIHSDKKHLKHTVQDHSLNENDNNNNRQRSVSSSSSASSSSDHQPSNIPYEILNNDDDDDDDPFEHTKETTNQLSS